MNRPILLGDTFHNFPVRPFQYHTPDICIGYLGFTLIANKFMPGYIDRGIVRRMTVPGSQGDRI
jgi:hypothetical protein